MRLTIPHFLSDLAVGGGESPIIHWGSLYQWAWLAPDGMKHWICMDFTVEKLSKSQEFGDERGTVRHVRTRLESPQSRLFRYALNNPGYPKDTIIYQALRHPETLAAAKEHPTLDRVVLAYDYIGKPDQHLRRLGYIVSLNLTGSRKAPNLHKILRFTARSGLDPVLDENGNAVDRSFVPRDTVEGLQLEETEFYER